MKLNKIQKQSIVIGVLYFFYLVYCFYDLYINWNVYRNPILLLDLYLFQTLYISSQTISWIFVFRNKYNQQTRLWKLLTLTIVFISVDFLVVFIYKVAVTGNILYSLIPIFEYMTFRPGFYIFTMFIFLLKILIKNNYKL